MRRGLKVAVGGARGVGKTTVLRAVQCARPETRVVHMSHELTLLTRKAGYLSFRDLDVNIKRDLREELGRELCHGVLLADGTTLLDLHYVDLDEAQRLIQPAELLALVDVFVVLEASLAAMHARRTSDATKRRSVDIARIEAEQAAERGAMQELAGRYGRRGVTIANDDDISQTVRGFLSLLLESCASER